MKRIWICLLWLACLCPMYGQGLRILFIGDSITDGNWGNSDGSAMPSAGRNLWDMNHIYGSGYMYLCASYYQSKYPGKGYEFFNRGISGNALADLEKLYRSGRLPNLGVILNGTKCAGTTFAYRYGYNYGYGTGRTGK